MEVVKLSKEGKNKGKVKSMNITNVDEMLKRKFKALCAERGKSLSEEIQRLMKEELVKEGKYEV